MENVELDVLQSIFDRTIQPRNVKLSAIQSITDNFSKDRIIGEGGFATVYKGVLRNGDVAVKRIRNGHTIDEKLFHREVNSLLMVNHKNIVRFLGFCSHTEHKPFQKEGSGEYILAEDRERILCFEYISNGSLENYIADELRGLEWDTRYSLIKGICEGLQYLHMEKNIMHMDLKPANVLIDYNMVAKITDFGLSRMVDNSQTKTTNLFSSPGYCPPEFIDSRIMSPKYDVYSLGVIIIQLVTGHRSIPDNNNVLRRWTHRWQKSGEGTPIRYQQIAKLVKIGIQCQEKEPYKRPSISNIIRVLNELEITESNVFQISPLPEDDMLGIEPLDLIFPVKLNNKTSVSLYLTNETNAFFAFTIRATRPMSYCIEPNKGIVAPRSKYIVNITFHPVDHAPQDMQYTGDFIMRSTKVNESLVGQNITEDIFNGEEGILVDEVSLTSTYKVKVPEVDVSLESLRISDTINLWGTQESIVSPTKEETKLYTSTSDEVILFDPPELCFPAVPDKEVLSLVKIMNITESYVCFIVTNPPQNTGNYTQKGFLSVIPPMSTEHLKLTREEKKDAAKDMQLNDELLVHYAIVDEGVKGSDLDLYDYTERKVLPIILTKTSLCASDELIEFDPPQLQYDFLPNKKVSMFRFFKIVNVTDHTVGFNAWSHEDNSGKYTVVPDCGILPPQSTQKIKVRRALKENKTEDMECKDRIFVWNGIVTEGLKADDVAMYWKDGDKELPVVLTKPGENSSR